MRVQTDKFKNKDESENHKKLNQEHKKHKEQGTLTGTKEAQGQKKTTDQEWRNVSMGASFHTRPRNASQLCTSDQNRLHPPSTGQTLTGRVWFDELQTRAAVLRYQCGPSFMETFSFITNRSLLRKMCFWRQICKYICHKVTGPVFILTSRCFAL